MLGDRVATPRLVKLVLSATMTRDPSKVGMLQLHSPRLISVGSPDERCVECCALHTLALSRGIRCQIPKLLQQWRVVVAGRLKPFALLSLLQSLDSAHSPALVFASSVRACSAPLLLPARTANHLLRAAPG
jgi:ATP-dependent RNA helicase DDX51/DBP6